jgi:hypothetical protein
MEASKLRRLRLTRHVAHISSVINAYTVSAGKSDGKWLTERPKNKN